MVRVCFDSKQVSFVAEVTECGWIPVCLATRDIYFVVKRCMFIQWSLLRTVLIALGTNAS